MNTADVGGGAERVAVELLEGMVGRGIDAWLAVTVPSEDHPRIVSVNSPPPGRALSPRQCRLWNARRALDRHLGREDFAFPSTRWLLDGPRGRPDVILAINLHGGYFDLTRLPQLSADVPVVLSLQDSWLFTGHCAVPGHCERWQTGCGQCPDLASPPSLVRDRTAANWRRKATLVRRSCLHAVAPSRWMLERARRSLLGPALAAAYVVPNGVDVAVFTPAGNGDARALIGIEPDAALAIFTAHGGLENPYKDGRLVVAAAERVAAERPLELVVVGAHRTRSWESGPLRVRELAYVKDRAELAAVYRAADVYLHAAPEESFCIAAAEALACGTPALVAAGGGLPEVVEHERTGLVTERGDLEALTAALRRLLADHALRTRLGDAARASARSRFSTAAMVDGYIEACEAALERGGG